MNDRKKKKKTSWVLAAFHIDVNIDPTTGVFTYVLEDTGESAQSIRPKNGDTVTWRVRLGGAPMSFQVEFDVFNPFGRGNNIIRSLFGRSKPVTVKLPPKYSGNLVFQYRVSIPTAWSDDPDVQPVPSDGDILPELVPNSILLRVDDAGTFALSVPKAKFPKGEVEWKWAADSVLIDDFKLTFDPAVPPWPTSTNSAQQRIDINFPVPASSGPHAYRIETRTTNQAVWGTLEITS